MFYDKYLALCKQKGIAPSRAAEEAGFAKSLVTKWKTNKIETPSAEILAKISDYFNLPISELLDEKEQPTEQYGELSESKLKLIKRLEDLSEDSIYILSLLAESLE